MPDYGGPGWTWKNTEWHEQCPQSPTDESFGRDRSSARKRLMVPWVVRDQAVRDFVGFSSIQQIASPGNSTISAFTRAQPIAITTSAAHGLVTGQRVRISGVTGQPGIALNQDHTITKTGATTFTLNSSYASGDAGSGGTVTPICKYIHRDIPFPHPLWPTLLWCDSFKCSGQGTAPRDPEQIVVGPPFLNQDTGFGDAGFDECMADVGFFSPSFEIMDDDKLIAHSGITFPDESTMRRYISHSAMDTAGKFQTLPSFKAVKWNTTAGTPMANTAAVIIPEGTWTVVWHEVPNEAIPWTAITQCIGKCNGAAIVTPWGTMPAGRILGPTPKISKPYKMVTGDLAVDITYTFRLYPQISLTGDSAGTVFGSGGVNSFYRHNTGTAIAPGFYNASRDGATNLRDDGVLVNNAGTAYSGADLVVNGRSRIHQLLFPPTDFAGLFHPEP